MDGGQEFARVLADSLRFVYHVGAVTDVGAGMSTGWRTLPMAVTALLVAGRSVCEIEDDPAREVQAGTAICLPAGVRHRFTHPVAGVSWWSHVDFQVLATVDVLALIDAPRLFSGPIARRIGEINRDLAAIAVERPLVSAVCARQALGLALLSVIVDAAVPAPRSLEALRAAQRLAPVLAVVEHDLRAADVPHLARSAHLSPSRLHAVFLHAFACSPMQYVRRRRLQRARELLATTDLAVQDIAERAGFEDPFHFSRVFKKAHAASPSEYRQQMREVTF
ncbi:MAG: helix-turn-helix transcriptional regulator [Planctomycetes bacterium]|nr:helix-turn-helix transcriptional regulator [Planctomycetota bacterium]